MLRELWMLSPWLLAPYAIAMVMPTWRWLLGCTLIVGGLIAYAWIDHSITMNSPNYNSGPGGALGIALFAMVTLGFASGVVMRAICLVISAYGHPKIAFTLALMGASVPFLVPAALDSWTAWQRRPAPAACIAAGFHVEIGGTTLAVPVASVFAIYRGPSSRRDAYYLDNNQFLRDLCAQSANGAQLLSATNLGIRFGQMPRGPQTTCKPPIPHWASNLCAAADSIRHGRIDQTDFPITAYVFSPDKVALGEFLGTPSTYRDSLSGPRPGYNESFVTGDARTPDGNPLTFVCHPQSDGTDWCRASYLWKNSTHLNYVFRSMRDRIAERGQRVDATLRSFLDNLATAPER